MHHYQIYYSTHELAVFSGMRHFTCKIFPKSLCILTTPYPRMYTSSGLHPFTPILCLLLAGSCDKEGYSSGLKGGVNMVWWGMWENSHVHFVHSPVACQPSSWPSRPQTAWTRAAFVPHLPATPCPALAPHLTLLSILLHLPCLPFFTRGPSPQNSTAGPLRK